MRSLKIIAVAVLILMAIPAAIECTEGAGTKPADEWTEPAVLCYYSNSINHVETIYVKSGIPIGSGNIPELTGSVYYWVRMDTGEVVTASTVFSPGTYVMKAYTTPPTPWGSSSDDSGSGGSDIDYGKIGIYAMIAVLAVLVGILYIKK